MKRFLACLLAAASLVSLAACAAPEGGNTMKNSQNDTQAVLLAAAAPGKEMVQKPKWEDYLDKNGEADLEAYDDAYEAWREDRSSRVSLDESSNDGLDQFYLTTAKQFLAAENGRNHLYSPLNLYLALAMLAECTDGESRGQILGLLGAENIESQRKKAETLWESVYCEDGQTSCLLGSSLWLDQNVSFVQDTLDTLARSYHASTYQGQMGSTEMNQAIQSWLNEQTGGLLKDAAEKITLSPQTVIALAATLYFRAAWQAPFYEEATQKALFHAPSGDAECDFLHSSERSAYYWGEKFEAACLKFEDGGEMWLVLPKEGYTPQELLEDEETQRFLTSGGDWENCRSVTLNLSLPKFDVSDELDLIDGLKALGVSDVFDASVSDFSPLTTDAERLAVTKATHAARVKIDEEGCEAAAFTVFGVETTAMLSPEEVDLTFDRPFLFSIAADGEQTLFAGIVNQPQE